VPKHAFVLVAVHCTQKSSGVLQAGAAVVQFASVVQPSVQTWATVLHTPFGPVHCAFVLHWTQRFATVSHTGLPFLQTVALAGEHSTHAPLFAPAVTQAGAVAVAHAAGVAAPRSPSHLMHVPTGLQIGVVPEHCAFDAHCTQVWLVSLQAGLAPTQSPFSPAEHSTHLPASGPAATHAGVAADLHALGVPELRSPSHATQAPAPLQTGVLPPQAASVRHCTQVFVVVLHDGVAPPHSALERHCTHCCAATLHFGVRPAQFASVVQPAVHVFVLTLQTPLAPWHCALDVHCTQRWLVVLQTGRPGGHAVTLPALHWTQGPARHAGLAGVAQAALDALPLSPLQATHTPAAVSQIGFEPTQALASCAVHSAHLLVVVLHTPLLPTQRTESCAVHSTHAPLARLHAGDVAVGHADEAAVPLSPLQATHAPAALQTGVPPAQLADVLH
jgi:hypothetical protein